MFLNLVGLVSVCAKFQLPSLSRSGIKVPGGVVGWWGGGVGLRSILVFSLSLSQAEQFSCSKTDNVRAFFDKSQNLNENL